MQTNEAVNAQSIQQAVIEKLALLSLDKQKQMLALADELTQTEAPPSKFRVLFEDAARDVPPEAWAEVSTTGARIHGCEAPPGQTLRNGQETAGQINEAVSKQSIQQAVSEKLALLSFDQQTQVLAFTEKLTPPESTGLTLWEMAQECIKDLPPEAFAELPADGAFNLDHYLYGAPKRYDEHGAPLDYEKRG